MKKILLWSAASLTAVVIVVAIVTNSKSENKRALLEMERKDIPTVKSCISPPIPGMDQGYVTFMVSNNSGGKIIHNTGTEIIIPALAFVRPNGTTATDSVRIRYREFHTTLDVFLSGIPMKYDSAGTSRTFETAGMLEILAFEGQTSLQLDEDKQISVTMASTTNDTKFNLYSLDTISGHWTYQGKDKVLPPRPELARKSATVHKTSVEREEPMVPVAADPKRFSFCIAYDKNEFSELNMYENILFEVKDNSFKSAYYKVNWDQISLIKSSDGAYHINLKKADTTIQVKAQPVFAKDDYEKAKAHFESLQQQHEKKVTMDEMEEKVKLNKVEKELTGAGVNLIANARTMMRITNDRTFSIRTMGTHNLDYPLPDEMQYAINLSNAARGTAVTAGPNTFNSIYVIEKGKNAVFTFQKGEALRFNPSVQNLIWTITSNSEIAFFSQADLRRLKNSSNQAVAPVPAANQEQALERIRKFGES